MTNEGHRPHSGDEPVAGVGPVSHAIFRVARLHKMFAGQLLRETGLYPGQELLMMQLWDEGPVRQVDLVRNLDSDAPTVTRTVRRLEQAGFVRRLPNAADGRSTLIEATRASRPLRHAVQRIWAQLEGFTVGGLSDTRKGEVLDVLETLEANLLAAERAQSESPAT